MSDTELNDQLQISDDTIEEKSFDSVLLLIRNGAVDAAESGDYLSYATLLDIQLSEPDNYTVEERESLLEELLKTLAGDKKLVYEIGWDLPSIILPYIETDNDFEVAIRQVPCVYKVMKLFEILALHGNAKELFLKSTELLTLIKFEIRDGKWETATKIFEVKVYCLFELIVSCLRRIQTLYPSRFLSMVVSSLISMIHLNPPMTMDTLQFMTKRVYDFARNYTPPSLPKNVDEDQATLDRILEDENYLQRKLLTAFLTESINLMSRHEIFGFSVSYFKRLQDFLSSETKYTSDYTLRQPILDRISELSQSFDMDTRETFVDLLESTEELVKFPDNTLSEDAYRIVLFETLVKDYLKKFAMSIVDMDANQVTSSIHGSIAIFTYQYCTENNPEPIKMSIKLSISFGLRILVPGLVHKSFLRRGLQDLAVFWMWNAIEQLKEENKTLEIEISSVPTVVLTTYLQCLMFILVSSFRQSYFRFVTLTLITRIISSAPEPIAYKLLLDALQECPYENVKAALVQVLKTLLTKDRIDSNLAEGMNSLKLEGSDDKIGDLKPPPVPSRDTPKMMKYINLTETRFSDICDLVESYIESVFENDYSSLNMELAPTLQTYLNLLIILKSEKCADAKRLLEIQDSISSMIKSVKQKTEYDPKKANHYNMAGILAVSVDRLGGSE